MGRQSTFIRALAWAAFWMTVYWFGMAQNWAFADIPPIPPRPWQVTILGPVGFWAAMVLAFAPLEVVSLPKSWGVAGLSLLLGGSMAVMESLVFPHGRRWLTLIPLGGSLACLAALRIVGFFPPAHSVVAMLSGLLLMSLVVVAYLSLCAVCIVVLMSPLRRILQSRMDTRT